MDGYTLSISRCSGGDGVEESFKAKIKRREAALDAEDETIRLVRLVPDSEDGIMDDVFRLEYGSCEYKV